VASIPIKTTSASNYTLSIPAGSSASTISVFGGGGGSSGVIYNNSWSTSSASDIKSNAIHVNGDAVFKGNITWQDRDMREWFESVEARLAILQPNPDLEAEWSELVELRQRYVELERNIIAKQELFNILKKSDLELNNL